MTRVVRHDDMTLSRRVGHRLDRIGSGYQAFLVWLVERCRRAAVWVVIGGLTMAGLSAVYTVNHLTLDTDPMNLLDPDLPFRQLQREFEAAFPQLDNLILVVVDQGSAEHRRDAVRALAGRLEQQPAVFSSVYQPQQDAFFDRYGLMYFDVEELWRMDERLTAWEPFLGMLVHDPSLRGLFSILTLALEEDSKPEQRTRLARLFALLSETMDAQRLGRPHTPIWKQAMLDDLTDRDDALHGFLLVRPRLDYSNLAAAAGPLGVLRQHGRELSEQFDVRIRLTGSIPIEEEERDTIAEGAGVAAGVSLGLVACVLLVGLRAVRLVSAMVCTLIVGLLWTSAFAVASIGSLNFISASAPVLFIGLGVDFGIQFGMRYREECLRTGSHAMALQCAAAGIGGALTLAAVAAALSFFSFLPTAYRGFAELGLIAGGGMFMALLANVTFFPALLTVFPLSVRSRAVLPSHATAETSEGLVSAMRFRRVILGMTACATVVAVAVLPLLPFDFNPLHLRDPLSEGMSTFRELLADPDTAPYVIQVIADNVTEADAIAERLRSVPEVDRVVTLSSFVPGEQEEKLAVIDEMALVLDPLLTPIEPVEAPSAEAELRAIRDFRETLGVHARDAGQDQDTLHRLMDAIDNLLSETGGSPQVVQSLRARIFENFPAWLDRLRGLMSPDEITLETLPESLRQHYRAQDGRVRVEVFPARNLEDNHALRQFVDQVRQVAPRAIGSPVGILEGGRSIVDACVRATILAIVLSALLLFVVLRRPGEVLFVLLPLVLTMVLTVAVCLALGIPLNLANVIAVPLVLGLGIAFGIYLILRNREGGSIVQVLQSSTSHAVFFSALTTMASFGVLGFSNHRGMASLGMLLVVVLTLSLVCALVVLPALMAECAQRGWWVVSGRDDGRQQAGATASEG